ncbi:tyrosine transporter TyrP [Vibrio sp. MACH09]|uniref:aromatic amino acid transport family protein n=1 Tax=unclassified Vibrio TaxID=2614977 RepID=UPI001493ABEC|nr:MULTISPECIES: aromatic amino acid transport family protein [unclassified Vibrio]NOI65180.1 amino acid permease [Vibrio sp. 99-8-1]GLO63278.1 tyrosine transporter TyrP [Vibrio sp. MACH09]
MKNTKLIGGGLIIAGTSIGAGMLSLPIVSAGLGFSTASIIMLILWALMTYTSLLMLEVHQYANQDATLHTLAKKFLGENGKYLAGFAMLFLFYSLSAAYIAGGGSQFVDRISYVFSININHTAGAIIFAIIVALIVAVGTHLVDKVNRVLFGLMMLAMAFVIVSLAPNISGTFLASNPMGIGLIYVALPVVFTSFGFHGSIPAIVNYLDGDTKKLKVAMYIGSCVPLLIYVFWLLCSLGVVSQAELTTNSNLSNLISSLSATLNSDRLSLTVGLFADLALVTSFLGVSLGLFEFLLDTTKKRFQGNRFYVALLTYLPPLAFALFYPEGFIMALGYAAIALVILAIFLPVAMVIKSRSQYTDGHNWYRVKGGKIGLLLSVAIGVLIIVSQLLVSIGVI